jgi:hypothetical protein
MGAENLEPIVNVTIEGIGYDGDAWSMRSGTPGEMAIFPESSEHGRALVEAARAHAVAKLDYFMAAAAVVRESLDFSVPNQPLRDQVQSVQESLAKAAGFAQVLVELAPWLYDDGEDDDDEPAPEPSPEPSEETCS